MRVSMKNNSLVIGQKKMQIAEASALRSMNGRVAF